MSDVPVKNQCEFQKNLHVISMKWSYCLNCLNACAHKYKSSEEKLEIIVTREPERNAKQKIWIMIKTLQLSLL